ncbi:N-acetylmuramoyl-L-alanine amidase [Dinghuibacter silviterrae]|uniref:N-acetylmuramoyl-L-alanine amidase n=1 Tax=Dinghuibacter silviterrae TaxID=1539049 RepID=A0A4R8DTK9_9BACT|nr:N-acetylmuramoyl-L-alanine amidase [Dinghuibacter silviterrae]TDX01652.1 N-acetylmuramoyl-L-alanine amidase [Dinghuibacter silviterrae]
MVLFGIYLVKVTLLSGLLYAYYHFLLRDRQTFGWSRFYLLAAAGVSVGVPLLNIPLHLTVPHTGTPTVAPLLKCIPGTGEADPAGAPMATAAPVIPWTQVALGLYALAGTVLLGLLVYHIKALFRLERRSEHHQMGDVTLIATDAPGTPFSFFRWIFWDRQLSVHSANGQAIFRHELAHVRQRHSVDKMFLQLLCAVLFPVFPLYLIRRELQLIHEYLADQAATEEEDAGDYARYLLEHALYAKGHRVAHAFHQHPLAKRIAMIGRQIHPPAWSRWMILPFFLAGSALFAFTPTPKAARTLTVVIDAGHGGLDPGAPGGGLLEKNITLDIARAVARLAPGYGVNILESRPGDSLVDIEDRILFAGRHKADAFVSIHVNLSSPGETGIKNFISVRNRFADSSALLGSLLAGHLGRIYPTEKVLRTHEEHIGVLDRNVCPAALIECGYISNPKDRAFISKPANQDKIARAILESLADYANGRGGKTLQIQGGSQ